VKQLVVGLIAVYQRTLSPDHGPLRVLFPHGVCRFHPTCSEYTKQAVLRHGVRRGLVMGGKRVTSCRPSSAGGYDPVN
jgi:putative membrane protein insertion efficiency factor